MTHTDELQNLQTELRRLALSGLAGIVVCTWLLARLTTTTAALLYLLASTVLWLLAWQQTHCRLLLNRASDTSPLYPALGWANRMTLGRGWLIAATGGFVLVPDVLVTHPSVLWIAAALYSIAAILDRVDGFIARRSQQTTQLGARLDTVFDALGLLVAPLLALQQGKIHASYLLVSVAYYLFVLGIKIREKNRQPVYPLPPSLLRRSLAGFQMGYVAIVLWPPFKAEVTVLAGSGFMVPLLIGFLVDWLVVSGRLKPQQGLSAALATAQRMVHRWCLPALRVVTVIAALLLLTRVDPAASWQAGAVISLFALGMLLMSLGLAGRAGALMMLMLLAWTNPVPVGTPSFVICLFAAIAILLLGCGRFSLWQADDDWVNRQDGA